MDRNKKRRIIIIVCAALLVIGGIALAFVLGDGRLDENSDKPTQTPTSELPTASAEIDPIIDQTMEPTPEPIVDNTLEISGGMVLASSKLSFGLASNGRLSYIGCSNGQAYCYGWKDVVKLAGNDDFTAGLTEQGTLLFSGDAALAAIVSEWHDVADITASDTALYALASDGRVYSTDGSTESMRAVTMFAAGADFLLCVHPDGSFSGIGNMPEFALPIGLKPAAIACGKDFVCAIMDDGSFYSSKQAAGFDEIEKPTHVFADGEHIAVIDAEGTLYTDCPLIESEIKDGLACIPNAEWFSSSGEHALIMLRDGSVLAFGDDSYMQCSTDNWQLLPYRTDEGYILGLTVGSILPGGSVLCTGDEITLETGEMGIAVILGDIDMDGDIDESDMSILKEYLSGSVKLSEVQKRAANVYFNSSAPLTVDKADLVQLGYHVSGYTEIDQYAKDFRYSVKLAQYENINTDVSGYIKIDKTNIEGPIMYGDKFYYHTHDYAKTPTSRGSLYLYYGQPVQNIVITGHNLRVAGIMLNQLHLIQNKYAGDFDIFKNRVWQINVFGETHLWEVFAMYEEKPSSPNESSQYYNCNYPQTMDSMTDEEIADWIAYQQVRSELDYQLTVTPDDSFITILTCADQHWESAQGGRIYFFLRRVDGH